MMSIEENSLDVDLKNGVKFVDLHLPHDRSSSSQLSPIASNLRNQLRDSLGISAGFVCGAGHQPISWHCGILAKFIAASSTASAHGPTGRWVHFLSDQDVVDPFRIDLPVRDRSGSVRRSSLRLASEQPQFSSDAVPFARPSQIPRRPDIESIASPAASAALDRLIAAIESASDAPNAGVQIARAILHCANRWVDPPCAIVESRSLLTCDAARAILDKMISAPERCAAVFNSALKHDPRAARPLRENGSRSEMPVWGVRDDGCRERIDAVEARRRLDAGLPLLPRAFLASGLMRLLCDLFIHGTGGVRYERVGEQWWRDFLDIELPDFGSATATVVPFAQDLGLDFDPNSLPRMTLRDAWWDPMRLDSHHLSPVGSPVGSRADSRATIDPIRAALLQRIVDAPRKSTERRTAYRALCAHIEALRHHRSAELASLEVAEAQNKAVRAQVALAQDRTWPFILMRTDAIDAMAATIRDQIRLSQEPRG